MNDNLHPVRLPRDSQVPERATFYSPDHFYAASALRFQWDRHWTLLRRRWWIVALCLLFIGGPAVFYATSLPPSYRSRAIMWLTSKLNLQGGSGFFSEEVSSYMSTQAELMKSPAIQGRAFQKVRAAFPAIAHLSTNAQPENLPFSLTIRSSPRNSVLNLEAQGPLAEPTRAFLDAVMTEYMELKKESHRQTSSEALTGITDQIKETERQTQILQAQLTAFERSNNISYLTEHGLSAGSHLARLEELLSDRRTELRLLELLTPEQFSTVGGAEPDPTTQMIYGERAARAAAAGVQSGETAYYQAVQQVEVLKAKRDEFARVLRPTHSKMVKLNQEIAGLEQLQQTLKQEGGQRAMAQLSNRKKALQLQIESLEAQCRAWETNASEASAKLTEHERMKQDVQRSQALYDRMIGLVQTVDLTKTLDQEPLSPLAPASPPRALNSGFKVAAAGIFLALAAGLGLLMIMGTLDDRFVSATELSCHLPEEVLGQVPETRLNLVNDGSWLLLPPEDQHAFTESFRSLRSSLFFMFEESARPRVILLTSSVPKEGKSTVAAHLAASLALAGSRVVIVDADLRRSSLHQLFGVSPKPGLREVLTQQVPLSKAILPVRIPHALSTEANGSADGQSARLFLLPSGGAKAGHAEILLDGHTGELIRGLAAQYDYVIIDSPPMLAADDAVALAAKADGIFMVVRASYTGSRMVREALDRLRKRRVKILGLVYNRATPSKDYYYRYSREYHSAA